LDRLLIVSDASSSRIYATGSNAKKWVIKIWNENRLFQSAIHRRCLAPLIALKKSGFVDNLAM